MTELGDLPQERWYVYSENEKPFWPSGEKESVAVVRPRRDMTVEWLSEILISFRKPTEKEIRAFTRFVALLHGANMYDTLANLWR